LTKLTPGLTNLAGKSLFILFYEHFLDKKKSLFSTLSYCLILIHKILCIVCATNKIIDSILFWRSKLGKMASLASGKADSALLNSVSYSHSSVFAYLYKK
jgi:hypothetical protein